MIEWPGAYHFGVRWRERVLNHFMQFSSSDVVMDAGCGHGYITQKIASRTSRIVGVDIASHTIVKLNEIKNRKGLKNISFVVCDLNELSNRFQRASFDKVFCLDTLEHVRNFENIMSEFHYLLKPGWELFFAVPIGGGHGRFKLPPQEAKAVLDRINFILLVDKVIVQPLITSSLGKLHNALKQPTGRITCEVDDFDRTHSFQVMHNVPWYLLLWKIAFQCLNILIFLEKIPYREVGLGDSGEFVVLAKKSVGAP